jgi:DNA primase
LARLPDSFLEEIRARTPLAALIGRRTKLSRSGRNWKGCCPFHGEKTPSFYVYDDGYHCYGCGAHGDAIGFVMDSQKASFMEAVELLAGEAGMDVPKPSPEAAEAEQKRLSLHDILERVARLYQENLRAPQGAAALAYLRGRGLTDETISRFGLGYSGDGRGALIQCLGGATTPAQLLECGLLRAAEDGSPGRELFYNRVMFPIRDRRGRVISFGGRIMGDGQPKYVNGPETAVFSKRRALYALDIAREAVRGDAPLVVVEGYMDVIALHQAGFPGAVAPLGTALTEDQLGLLWQLSPAPILCFDGDAAGGRAAARAADIALPALTPARTLRIATLPAREDPDTLVRTQGAAAFTAVLDAARPLSDALFALLRETAGTATPEQRAAFRARLEEAAARIGDRGLASEYRRTLLDSFFNSMRAARPARGGATAFRPLSRPATRPRPAEVSADAERTRHLIAILLRHPVLLPRLEEAFAQLALPASARRLFDALQAWADGVESLDFNALINHLSRLRLMDDAAWALGDTPLPLPLCASQTATVVEAEAGWWRIYGLMRRGLLEAELAEARRDCAASFTAEAVQRVTALAGALLGRSGEEPGSELGSDD